MKRDKLAALIAAIIGVRESIPDETALEVKDLYPEWSGESIAYAINDRVLYDGTLFKCLQAHESQSEWDPADAPSLWAVVLIPDPEEIPDWVQPDSTNPYMTGDKVRHIGKVWQSLVDNNVWEPSEAVPTLWAEINTGGDEL